MRGRPATIIQETPPRKFTRVYEDEDTIETWTYDLNKTTHGPVLVEIKYKAGAEKRIKERAKETKQIKQTARQMNKINKRNKK
jgi:hypothetical protein